MSVPERYWCWTATGAGDEPQPVVSCFAGSPGALAGLEVAAGPAALAASLARLRPDLELEPAGALLSTWSDDPGRRRLLDLAAGASSPGLAARPTGPLAFAGEHLGGEFARADGGRDPQRAGGGAGAAGHRGR